MAEVSLDGVQREQAQDGQGGTLLARSGLPISRLVVLVLVGVVVAGAGVGLLALGKRPQWTSSSPEALAELEAALGSQMLLRLDEMRDHLEQALRLDPDMVAARLMLGELLQRRDPERAHELFVQLAQVDLDEVSGRERFLVQWRLALEAGRGEEAARVLAEVLETRPDDPFVLRVAAEDRWVAGELEQAEQLYRRLLDVNPNWLIAYNNLGYLAMLQGRFAEAEELFTTYRFIAPDQANPHDSLGELLVILGDPAAACESFERALEIWPEFDSAIGHLAIARTLLGQAEAANELLDRTEAAEICSKPRLEAMRCEVRYLRLLLDRAWPEIQTEEALPCLENLAAAPFVALVVHRAQCERGRLDVARALEEGLRREMVRLGLAPAIGEYDWAPYLEHMIGVREAIEGRRDAAIQRLRRADAGWVYQDSLCGILKLHNRLVLIRLLEAAGRNDEARHLAAELEPTAPSLIESFRALGLETLDPVPAP
jgi:tetratricopeptide (TPR) repeat protein